ncbi:MAG: methyltransferase [Erysipelotrichaceae bacterium]|nr:methyltransferase [Erysipelotrichaceae bacterium]
MAHYFTDNKDLKSDRHEFTYYFGNELFCFTTDNGVFSKENIDYGSYILIKTIYSLNLGSSLLDLGCGYGPIGIILKRFNPSLDIEMVDVNSRATELAVLNNQINSTDIKVHLTDDITKLDHKFDTIVLNPPIRAGKAVMYDLYEKSRDMLNHDGHFYIVIKKSHGAMSSKRKLETLFAEVNIIEKENGYFVIDSFNPAGS